MEFYCELCNIDCQNERSFLSHLNGDKHRRKAGLMAAGGTQLVHCQVCNVSCPNKPAYEQHLNGERHRRKLATLEAENNIDDNVSCPNEFMLEQHVKSDRRKRQVAAVNVMSDSTGISMLTGSNSSFVGNHKPAPPTIRNEVSRTNVISQRHHAGGELVNPNNANDMVEVKPTGLFYCAACNIHCQNECQFQQHLDGKKHKKRVAALDVDGSLNNGAMVHASSEMNAPIRKYISASRATIDALYGTPRVTERAASPPPHPPPHRANSSELKEVRPTPIPSNPSLMENSDEEGEVDEVKEDIEKLYDELEEPDLTSSGNVLQFQTPKVLIKEEENYQVSDSVDNVDDNMFGDESDERLTEPKDVKIEEDDVDSDVDDMFGDNDGDADSGEFDQNTPQLKEQATCASGIHNNDAIAEINLGRNIGIQLEDNRKPAIEEEHTVILDSGLGFVLDYSPDTPINTNIGAPSNQDTGHASDFSDPKALLESAEDQDDDEIDMFGPDEEDDGAEDGNTPEQTQKLVSETSKTAADALSSENETEHNQLKHRRQHKRYAADTATPMTAAAVTMAAAEMPLKRAKITGQQSKPRVYGNIPKHYDAPSDHAYYPPVHPDKYWCCMRSWDFLREFNDAMRNRGSLPKKKETSKKRPLEPVAMTVTEDGKNSSADPLPTIFESVQHYKALWASLLIDEAKAQILSEVVSSQSSPSTSWIQGSKVAVGTSARLERSRTARDHSSSCGIPNSSEPSVDVHITSTQSAGIGRPVCTNDLLLFVRQLSTIELAVRGKAFEALDEGLGSQELRKGRFGFVGHALNNRSRSLDGLLVRVSQKYWSQFESLNEIFIIPIGSNVTGKRREHYELLR